MTHFIEQLIKGLTDCQVSGGNLLLAVSGGADSVALLCGMIDIRDELNLQLTVGHLNHHLRGEESDADAQWLANLCANLDVPLVSESRDVAVVAKSKGLGLEEAAREMRYAFLEQIALNRRCSQIALAHNADDQAETILHHILRGTGITGLRGMQATRRLKSGVLLVRPMLEITRNEIETWLEERNQNYRRDMTNLVTNFTRNRIRNSLLPELSREFNPKVSDALRRLGRQASEISETMQFVTKNLLREAVEDKNPVTCRINCDVLCDQPMHLIRDCLVQLWKDLDWPRQRMGYREWHRLAEMIVNGGSASLPGGIEARRRGTLLILRREPTRADGQ